MSTSDGHNGQWRIIVIGQDAFAIGGHAETYTLLPGLLYSPGYTLGMFGAHSGREAVLIIPMHWHCDDPRAEADAHGWTAPDRHDEDQGDGHAFGAWTRFVHRESRQVVWVGIADQMDATRTPLFRPADVAIDPYAVAEALDRYAQATGALWHATSGITGVGMIRDRIERRAFERGTHSLTPLWHLAYGQGIDRDALPVLRPAGDLYWLREAVAFTHAHTFDLNAMYLNACSAAMLPAGALHTYAGPFDAGLGGYWQVALSDIPEHLCDGTQPPVFSARVVDPDTGLIVLTTPVMKLLSDLGVRPTIIQAWVSDDTRRLLRPWAEQVRDARTTDHYRDHAGVRSAIKRTWTETVGMFGRDTSRIRRPDWRHIIIDTARVGLLRKLYAAHESCGLWPLRVNVDAVTLGSTADETPADVASLYGFVLGDGLGQFHHEDTTEIVPLVGSIG